MLFDGSWRVRFGQHTKKDAEKAAVAKEKQLLKTDFSSELATVKMFYVERGVSEQTAALIAQDLMAKSPLRLSSASNTT